MTRKASGKMSESRLEVRVLDDIGHINLRGDSGNTSFKAAAEKALGQALPVEPNTLSNTEHCICWLGPDEWLIMTDAMAVTSLLGSLRKLLDGQHVAINDLSSGQVALRLDGADARSVLTKGCTLDFHHDEFSPGDCAQSGLAKANALFACVSDANSVDVVVRRSFLAYVLKWFETAGSESGIEFR
jgi:sarcosine oxidase subunit gamma